VALLGINNLRAVNTTISSTPVASTNNSFIINDLLRHFNFVQQPSTAADSPPGVSVFPFSPITNQSNDRLFLGGIAGEKWMVGFRTAILVQDLYKFLFAKNNRSKSV